MGELIGPINRDNWLLLKTLAGPRGTIAWCKKQDSRRFARCIEIETGIVKKILRNSIESS